MRILVTGAGGMLGHDVIDAARAAGHEPIAFTRAELDITDPAAVRAAVDRVTPRAVVNCAAWTAVDRAESEPEAALVANGTGPGILAGAAIAAGAWTIHVSTDYVFDGSATRPYVESDPTGPRSMYGRSKLAGEQSVAGAARDAHTIVRSSWLFGVHGASFPATMLRLAAERDELTVVDDQTGCPTFTGDLAQALVGLVERPVPGVLHVAAAGECTWCGFARAIVAASGHADTTTVRGLTTAEYPLPAPRPAYSVLRSERDAPQLPDWQDGLERFLSARVAS